MARVRPRPAFAAPWGVCHPPRGKRWCTSMCASVCVCMCEHVCVHVYQRLPGTSDTNVGLAGGQETNGLGREWKGILGSGTA